VSSFLLPGGPSLREYTDALANGAPADYAGFNLLVLSPRVDAAHGIAYDSALITNSGGGGVITARPLSSKERQIGAVSNGIDGVDAADWPKVKQGCASLDAVLSGEGAQVDMSPENFAEKLLGVLTWQPNPPPANRLQLRTSVQISPLRMSSSLAPDAPTDGPDYYGTRLSTVVLVKRDGSVLFIERDIWKLDKSGSAVRGDPRDDRIFKFELNGA